MTNSQNRFWWRIILAMCIGAMFIYCIFFISEEQPRLENYICGAVLFGFIYWSTLTPRKAGFIGFLQYTGNKMGGKIATIVILTLSLIFFSGCGIALFGFAGEQLGGDLGAIFGCFIGIMLGSLLAIWTTERLMENFVDKVFNGYDQRSISKEILKLKKKFPWICPISIIFIVFITYYDLVNKLELEIAWHKLLLLIFLLVFFTAVSYWYSVKH